MRKKNHILNSLCVLFCMGVASHLVFQLSSSGVVKMCFLLCERKVKLKSKSMSLFVDILSDCKNVYLCPTQENSCHLLKQSHLMQICVNVRTINLKENSCTYHWCIIGNCGVSLFLCSLLTTHFNKTHRKSPQIEKEYNLHV